MNKRFRKDYTGMTFGNLVVLSHVGHNKHRQSMWLCKCDYCGNEKAIMSSNLKRNKSCGCLERCSHPIPGISSRDRPAYIKWRKKNDPSFRLRDRVSCAVRSAVKSKGGKKTSSVLTDLPFTIAELKSHLESLWEPWMNWDNYGGRYNNPRETWWIDHIVPQSHFNFKLTSDCGFKECWSLENLRPIEKKKNVRKGNKITI